MVAFDNFNICAEYRLIEQTYVSSFFLLKISFWLRLLQILGFSYGLVDNDAATVVREAESDRFVHLVRCLLWLAA